MKTKVLFLFTLLVLVSCDSSKLTEVKMSQFEGKWKLVNRSVLEGIEIEIKNDGKNNFTGVITKINDNKFVKMFLEVGDPFVASITRNSNFEFTLKEKKLASALFGMYDLSTSAEFVVQFSGKNTINFGKNGIEGQYIRVK